MVLPVLNLDIPLNAVIKEESVNLTYISNYGNKIVYVLNYSFNPKLAARLRATKLMISMVDQQGNTNTSPQLIKGFTPEQITENLLQQVNIYKAASKVKNQYPFSVVRDLTKYFNPKTIENQPLNSIVYINRSVGELNSSNSTLNLNNQNLNSNVNSNTYTSTNSFNLRKSRVSLKQTQKIDPASLYIKPTNTMVPTSKAMNGIIPEKPFLQNQIFKTNPKALNLVKSFLSKTTSNNQEQLTPQSYVTEIKKITTDLLSVGDRLFLPINLIGQGDFKIVFELYDIYDNKVQKFDVFVPHNTNVNNVYITQPPEITKNAATGIDFISFSINQIDRAAHGVSIFRKKIFTQQNVSDAGYTKLLDIPLRPGAEPYLFKDTLLTTSDVIYRFVPYDKNKQLASVFSTSYVRSNSINKNGTNIPVPKRLSTRQSYCVFDYSIDNDSIIIKATNIPADAVAIQFYKRNKTINEQKYSRLGNIIRIQPNSSIPNRLIDSRVKLYNTYEYKIGIIYPDGIEQLVSNLLAVEFRPIEKNIAESTITNITNNSYVDGTPDVSFTVTYSYNNNQYEDIKKLLIDQNLLAEYGQEIVTNREFLGRLFAYKVLRLNMATGELEDFGIITDNNFSDRKQGLAKGVKPLQVGVEYSYKVTTYLRNPETLFPTVTRTVGKGKKQSIKQNSNSKTYTLYPYEWLQPVTFRAGTLYTDTSVRRSYPNGLGSFEFGNVVDIKEVTVKVVSDLPVIFDAKVNVIQNQRCLISWGVKGNLAKIDHFMIIRDILGIKTIIGAAHAFPSGNNGKINFIDTFQNNEKGQATYAIIPIYYDDTEGTQVKTNTILIN